MSAAIALVWTTFDDASKAHEVTSRLVEERLVACGQVELASVSSCYRWKGAVQSAEECRVLLKLPTGRVERLRERLAELHPYEVPEFVVMEAEASKAYASWVEESCS